MRQRQSTYTRPPCILLSIHPIVLLNLRILIGIVFSLSSCFFNFRDLESCYICDVCIHFLRLLEKLDLGFGIDAQWDKYIPTIENECVPNISTIIE